MPAIDTTPSFDNPAVMRKVPLAPRIVLAAATIGAGLCAGLFYTYQISVTRALAEVDDVTYVTMFQTINETILNPWFRVMFLGTPPLIAAALVLNRRSTRLVTALVGAGLVLNIALVAITVFGNVPLNDDLAGYDTITSDTAAIARSDFEEPWNRLNLARTAVAVTSFAALTAATIVKPVRDLPRSTQRRSPA